MSRREGRTGALRRFGSIVGRIVSERQGTVCEAEVVRQEWWVLETLKLSPRPWLRLRDGDLRLAGHESPEPESLAESPPPLSCPAAMDVAPREPGRINTIPPRANAGNLDIHHLGPGSTVWLPVFVDGALFACGDCHAAQGDGEVCGTGVEAPMRTALSLAVRKDMTLQEVQFQPAARPPRLDLAPYHATTAHGPDLMENAKNAVRYMIDWLVNRYGVTRSQAYLLCSTAGDLRISEIVDAPNWIVSFYMPLGIFSP